MGSALGEGRSDAAAKVGVGIPREEPPHMTKRMPLSLVISHWYQLVERLQASSQAFYASLETALEARQIPDAYLLRISMRQGGLLSARRLYLRVWRRELVFDVCAAPWGTGFFVSWWLYNAPGCLTSLLGAFGLLPGVGVLGRAPTFYEADTTLMFQEAVHDAVLEVVDELTASQGLRRLSGIQRKPVMRELYE